MAFVYILQSIKDNRYYIGATDNLNRRLAEHNQGQTKSTKFRRPFVLVYKEEFDNIISAKKKERLIKSYKGGNAFKELIKKSTKRE